MQSASAPPSLPDGPPLSAKHVRPRAGVIMEGARGPPRTRDTGPGSDDWALMTDNLTPVPPVPPALTAAPGLMRRSDVVVRKGLLTLLNGDLTPTGQVHRTVLLPFGTSGCSRSRPCARTRRRGQARD